MRVAKEALRLSKGAAHAWECAKSAATDTRVGACRYLVVILLEMKPRVNDRGLSQPTVAYHSSRAYPSSSDDTICLGTASAYTHIQKARAATYSASMCRRS